MKMIKASWPQPFIDSVIHRMQQWKVARLVGRQQEMAVLTAIDEVVDKADPRIRLVRNYRQKLRQAVQHTLQYTDFLVANVPGPIEVNSKAWRSDPYVNAFFSTAQEMQTIFSRSRQLTDFFKHQQAAASYAVLAMKKREKKMLGMRLQGDTLQREAPLTTVSFTDHLVGLPGMTEATTRAELQRLALNFLVTQALEYILSLRTRRQKLEEQRRILQTRLKIAQTRQRGLDALLHDSDKIESQSLLLQQKLAENEQELQKTKVQLNDLDDYVIHLNTILAQPEEHLAMNSISVRLNRLGIKLEQDASEQGSELTLAEVRGGKRLKRVFAIVKYPREELLNGEELFARVGRYYTTA